MLQAMGYQDRFDHATGIKGFLVLEAEGSRLQLAPCSYQATGMTLSASQPAQPAQPPSVKNRFEWIAQSGSGVFFAYSSRATARPRGS